jgi:allantoate deiminase
MDVRPGAPNVVPGTGIAFLDVRHADDAVRERAAGELRAAASRAGEARGVAVDWELVQAGAAVPCDPALTDRLAAAVADAGLAVERLPSGAGHDGVMLSAVAPVAMLFVRCAGGLSHHPGEAVAPADAGVALDVVYAFVRRLAEGTP